MTKLRIGFITFEYPPSICGGAGVYAYNITKEIAKLGHEVHVITRKSTERKVKKLISTSDNIFIHRVPHFSAPFVKSPTFWLGLFHKCLEVQKEFGEFDIIHGNQISDLSLSSSIFRQPRVVTIHHLAYSIASKFNFLKRILNLSGELSLSPFLEKIVINRADMLIAVSNFTKRSLMEIHRVPSEKIVIIPNGINVNEYDFAQEEIDRMRKILRADNAVLFLYVGRLDDPRKNVQFLLKAFKIVSEKIENVKLLLIGQGHKEKIQRILYKFNIRRNVLLLGYVSDDTLRKCYSACDVFVTASLLEGFGLTILEAMAAGKPVVALKTSAVTELISNNKNGFLIEDSDPEKFANAMLLLAIDEKLRKSIGNRNRELVANRFSWRESAILTVQTYENLLHEN